MENTRYYDLTESQKLVANDAQLERAIQLEALHRGIAVPMQIRDLVKSEPSALCHIPANTITVFEIFAPQDYSTKETGVAFMTLEAAQKALEGAISVVRDSYPTRIKLGNPDFTIQATMITATPAKQFSAAVDDYLEDLKPYEKLVEECYNDYREIRQRAYDAKVLAEKRKRYLELAGGNETIAANFWRNVEKTDWPSAV